MTNLVKGFFGGTPRAVKRLQGFNPSGFSSTGLTGSFNRATNTFDVRRTGATTSALSDLQAGLSARAGVLGAQANELLALRPQLGATRTGLQGLRGDLSTLGATSLENIRGLRDRVRPGFGDLTRSRVEAVRSARTRAVGNLRDELSRRRVLGSSFASREIGAQEAEFAKQEAEVRAQSFIEELGLTSGLNEQEFEQQRALVGDAFQILAAENGLTGQEAALVSEAFQARAEGFANQIAGFEAVLNQLNLETGIAAELSNSSSQLMLSSLMGQAQAFTSQDQQNLELFMNLNDNAQEFFSNMFSIAGGA